MDETLKKALEALKFSSTFGNYGEVYNEGIDAAIAIIESRKPVVRMLTDEEIEACYYTEESDEDVDKALIRKAAEVWGLTIGEHG